VNELQVFDYTGKQVRTVMINDEPWFVLKDVCDVLDLSDTNKVAERLDADDLTRIEIVSGGQNRNMYAVNEYGVFDAVLQSRKPEAKAFKRWLTHEVLPSIKKHGIYATPATIDNFLADPDFAIRTFTVLKEERIKRELAEKQNAELFEDKETLEAALNISLKYRTVMQYNQENNCGWNMKTCQKIGKGLTAYCRGNGIDIKKCETNDERFKNVNSYPLSAWQGYLTRSFEVAVG